MQTPLSETMWAVKEIPELLSDWDDFDSEMRLRRLAAATQPSLLLRRFLTNLQRKQELSNQSKKLYTV